MTIVRCVTFSFLITLPSHSQAPREHRQFDLLSQAETPVRTLYQQLVSRPVADIPTPGRMKLISPYLSSSLLHSIAQARAGEHDWFRQHPQKDVKPPLTWVEFGIFSGANDESRPSTFQIEKLESANDEPFSRIS